MIIPRLITDGRSPGVPGWWVQQLKTVTTTILSLVDIMITLTGLV